MTEPRIAEGTNKAFSHTKQTTAGRQHVWQVWTNVDLWKDWDKGLKTAEMKQAFALGSEGRIIPISGPKLKFEVTEYVEGKSYTIVTAMPLAKLTVRRTFVDSAGTIFRHDVHFSGLAAGLWARALGPGFRQALPETMDSVATIAEAKVK